MMESTDGRPQSRGMGDGADSENWSSRPLDTEREKEVATIREQLEEHQRLLRESEVGVICALFSFADPIKPSCLIFRKHGLNV